MVAGEHPHDPSPQDPTGGSQDVQSSTPVLSSRTSSHKLLSWVYRKPGWIVAALFVLFVATAIIFVLHIFGINLFEGNAPAALSIILLLCASAGLLILVPRLQVAGRFQDPELLYREENAARGSLAQLLGAIFLGGGLAFTWLQFAEVFDQQRNAQEQLTIARRGEVTQRFTAAVDDSADQNQDIRLGGLLSLGRIARDSPEDRAMIISLLQSYLTKEAPYPVDDSALLVRTPQLPTGAQDIVNVLGQVWGSGIVGPCQMTESADQQKSKLAEIGEEFALFKDVNLRRAQFRNSSLDNAKFVHVDLDGAIFVDSSLIGADFSESTLHNAIFLNVDLLDAKFGDQSSLTGAQFYNSCNISDDEARKISDGLRFKVSNDAEKNATDECGVSSDNPPFVHLTYYEDIDPKIDEPEGEILLTENAAKIAWSYILNPQPTPSSDTPGPNVTEKPLMGWAHSGVDQAQARQCVADHIVRRIRQHANTVGFIDACEIQNSIARSDLESIIAMACGSESSKIETPVPSGGDPG